MGFNLAVFTAILYLLALIQCCYAAGGTSPSDDPVSACLTVMISNRLLYDLTGGDSNSPSESTVRGWIAKLNEAIHCGLRYTERLARVLTNRANHVRWKVRKFGRSGWARESFMSLYWKLTTPVAEIEQSLTEQCSALQQQVQTLETELRSSQRILRNISNPGSRSTKRTAKHYSVRHERRRKRQHEEQCSSALSWLEDDGLTPVQLVVMNNETKCTENIILRKDLESALNVSGQHVGDNDADVVSMMLYVKDKYNISGGAYHEMASLCRQMPRHHSIKQRISELNSRWNFTPTPEGTQGVQQALAERLQLCVQRLVDSTPPDASFKRDGKIRVKVTGDGTNIGKHLHVVNFAFTLLEEGDKAYGASGNHCIAIFKESESYSSMKLCLQDIAKDVKELESITIGSHRFDIEYFLGGDWKFLAMVTGIDSATSTHACIWCKCPALERYDSSQVWSISDCTHGARTIEENQSLARSRSKKYNVSNEPIFTNIPLTRVIVDNLHMFLRVADTLIDLLLLELRRLDKIDKATKVKSLDQLQYIKKFEKTISSLGISGFSFWIGRESKKLKCRTLTGPEKLIAFEKLDIVSTFPEVPNCAEVQSLWRDLLNINKLLSVRPQDLTEQVVTEFELKSKNFVRSFVEIYPAKHVTPYMHCMMMHVTQFLRINGALLPFTQHGLEKYNDCMTKDYFRSSSHRGQECLVQIMQKQNRIEHLEHTGAKRKKRFEITCSNCSEKGHNKGTCTKPCNTCGHSPFCAHLVKSNGKKIPECQSVSPQN